MAPAVEALYEVRRPGHGVGQQRRAIKWAFFDEEGSYRGMFLGPAA